MWFDDAAAFDTALATPHGQKAREAVARHAAQRLHVRVEALVLI
jgi:quinol monooxygenase YgiN